MVIGETINNPKMEYQTIEECFFNNLDIIYQTLISAYEIAYGVLDQAYESMQDGYYSKFIDPNSDYQKAWLELAELKQAYLDQRVVVANLTEEETDEKIFQEVQKLESLKSKYEAKLAFLESIEKASTTVYETLVATFETSLETMKRIEEKLPDSIQTITFEALMDTEKKLMNGICIFLTNHIHMCL